MVKRRFLRLFLSLAFLLFIIYYLQNDIIAVSCYEHESPKIPASFNDFKILQISDWHNKDFGPQLIQKVENTDPDIIVLTGDFIDVYNPNKILAFEFLEKLTSKYPVYYITGNHEKALFKKDYSLKPELKNKDIIFLENSSSEINKDNESITIYGIRDYTYNKNIKYDLSKTIDNENTNFSILLAHQPQYFDTYSKYNVDLVLSGHEHGGQIRLPGIGSIYSHQGWFADWTEGSHELNNSTMIVSRGLGNSKILPIRLFNQPELVLITLKSTKT